MELKIKCDFCGKIFKKEKCRIKAHNFCSRRCLADFSSKKKNPNGYSQLKDYTNMSKHFKEMNKELNPTRMTDETREKIREARLGTGEGKTYKKYYGKHEHRIIAELILGRKLKAGEVVHHIDGNKRDNSIDNILILPSQSEHAKLHQRERRFWSGGDAK
ncbi:MAG: HNH endonuclease signature motif containing protein [Anaerovoracaceae bacterium]